MEALFTTIAITTALLGDDSFAVREAATDVLKAGGPVAEAYLAKFTLKDEDPERVYRANRCIEVSLRVRARNFTAALDFVPWIDFVPDEVICDSARQELTTMLVERARAMTSHPYRNQKFGDYAMATVLLVEEMFVWGTDLDEIKGMLNKMRKLHEQHLNPELIEPPMEDPERK